jgi:hypothetical protein
LGNVSDINGVSLSSITDINGVARANLSDINGVTVPAAFTNSKSLNFDGVNDSARWASNTTITGLIGNTSHAWSYWVKSSDFSQSGSGYYSTLIYALNFFGAGVSVFFIGAIAENSHANAGKIVVSAVYLSYISDSAVISSLNNNAWNHIVCSIDDTGSARNVSIYINGSAVAGTNDTTNSDDFSSIDFGDLALGSQTFNAGSDSFDAVELDEISLYNTTLSSSDVTAIYNSGLPVDESSRSGLIGYWRLEDNGDDSSSNSNSLTISGAQFTTDVPS